MVATVLLPMMVAMTVLLMMVALAVLMEQLKTVLVMAIAVQIHGSVMDGAMALIRHSVVIYYATMRMVATVLLPMMVALMMVDQHHARAVNLIGVPMVLSAVIQRLQSLESTVLL